MELSSVFYMIFLKIQLQKHHEMISKKERIFKIRTIYCLKIGFYTVVIIPFYLQKLFTSFILKKNPDPN